MSYQQYLALGYVLVEFIIDEIRYLPMLIKFEQHYFSLAWAHEDYQKHFTDEDGEFCFNWLDVYKIYPELRDLTHDMGTGLASMAFPYSRLIPFFVPGTYKPFFALEGVVS